MDHSISLVKLVIVFVLIMLKVILIPIYTSRHVIQVTCPDIHRHVTYSQIGYLHDF